MSQPYKLTLSTADSTGHAGDSTRPGVSVRAATFCLHDIVNPQTPDNSGFDGPLAAIYKLTETTMREHLRAFGAAQIGRPALVTELTKDDTGRRWMLTFDDGGASSMRIADLVESCGWRAHFFIPTEFLGTSRFISKQEVRDLQARGHVIGGHSHSHTPIWRGHTFKQVSADWRRCREVLTDTLGTSVDTAAAPYGFCNALLLEACAEVGFRVMFTLRPTTRIESGNLDMVLGRYIVRRNTATTTLVRLAQHSRASEWAAQLSAKSRALAAQILGDRYDRVRLRYLDAARRG